MAGKGTGKVMTKSQAAKEAAKGTDMGSKGKGFDKLAETAAKAYGSVAAGKKVAGAQFQALRRKGKL